MKLGSVIAQDQTRTVRDILRALDMRLTAADNFAPDGVAGQVLTSNGPNDSPTWQDIPLVPPSSGGVDGSGVATKLALWADSDTLIDSIVSQLGIVISVDGSLVVASDVDIGNDLNVLGDTILGSDSADTITPLGWFDADLIPVLVATTYVADFVAANGTALTATTDEGYGWVLWPGSAGAITIQNNRAVNVASSSRSYGIWQLPVGDADLDITLNCTASNNVNSFRADIIFRFTGNGLERYEVEYDGMGASFFLNRYDSAGTGTNLIFTGTPAGLNTDPHVVRVTVIGSLITVYFDGVVMGSVTDSTYTSGKIGIVNSGSIANHSWIDTLTVTLPRPVIDVGSSDNYFRRGYFEDLSVNGINYEWPDQILGFVLKTDINGNLRWGKVQVGDIEGLGSLEGPEGPEGPMGPVGPRGLQGIQGIPGVAGAEGPPGEDGSPGTPGSAGAAGSVGATGATGPAGPMGPAGNDGEDGNPGPPGPAGTAGATGAAGSTGATGPAGADGIDGVDGAPGLPGAIGPAGHTGPRGQDGEPGDDTLIVALPSPITQSYILARSLGS